MSAFLTPDLNLEAAILTTSEFSVGEISSASGFAQPNHLFRTFRRFLGCSPRVYRVRQRAKQLKQKPIS